MNKIDKKLLEAAFKQQWFSALNERFLKNYHITYVRNHNIEHAYVDDKDGIDSDVMFDYSLKDFRKSISRMLDDILEHTGYLSSNDIDDIKSYEARCFDNDDFVNYSIDELVFEYVVTNYTVKFEEYFEDEIDKLWMDLECSISMTDGFDDIAHIEVVKQMVEITIRKNYMR